MNLGKILKQLRINTGWNASRAAEELSITPQHLSRIENGKQTPSRNLLEVMIEKYHAPFEDAEFMRRQVDPASSGFGEASEVSETVKAQPDATNIQVDPLKTPVQYTNAVAVSSDDFGIVIDAGQRIASSNKVQIVARIGFSLEHGIKICEALEAHIKKMQRKAEN